MPRLRTLSQTMRVLGPGIHHTLCALLRLGVVFVDDADTSCGTSCPFQLVGPALALHAHVDFVLSRASFLLPSQHSSLPFRIAPSSMRQHCPSCACSARYTVLWSAQGHHALSSSPPLYILSCPSSAHHASRPLRRASPAAVEFIPLGSAIPWQPCSCTVTDTATLASRPVGPRPPLEGCHYCRRPRRTHSPCAPPF